MTIFLIGVSHRTAPVEVRERLAFGDAEIPDALARLVDRAAVGEASIVSTCNRVEIIATGGEDGIERAFGFLEDWRHVRVDELGRSLYTRTGRDAVHHLFRVAASLDSMVVGEPQILGQVREAYRRAVEAGTVGRTLDPLFQRAFAVAKRVRTETSIGESAVSVSYVAVELAKKIFDSLADKTAMLVGAGEMAELALRHLADAGVHRLMVANRTAERAEAVAGAFGAHVVPFEDLSRRLGDADIVICSTGAPDYVIKRAAARAALDGRRNRPFFFIDISVPRQIDPEVGKLENVYLFDMDDLHRVVESNLREREREAAIAESIVEHEVRAYLKRLESSDIGPTVAELKQRLNEVAVEEFERQRRRLGPLTAEQEEAIRSVLLPSIINKIAHPIIAHMREEPPTEAEPPVSIWRRIFRLGGEGGS